MASFFTVANKKWRSIELSQISHFRVIQSEIWVRDYFSAWYSIRHLGNALTFDTQWLPPGYYYLQHE